MDLENNEFVQFTTYAQNHNLEYMVIGGFALYLNGLNRATNDVDIWINPTNENGSRLVSVFRSMDLDESALAKLELLDYTEAQVFGFNEQLDILTHLHRLFKFSDVFERSRKLVTDYGATIHFLHLNDLREVKILARRPQDIRDVIMIDDFLKLQEDSDRSKE
jgi:hypothetical protein